MRIMSVDDSKLIRMYVRSAAEQLGYEFLEADDGKEALRKVEAENGNIDLVLLDWHMPEMEGLEVLKRLKADERYKHIPVLMVTTEVERASVIQAIEAGARNYLMKPFTQDKLVAKILESLGLAE